MLAGQHMLIFYNKIEKYLHAGLKMQSGGDKNEAFLCGLVVSLSN